jgi:hypothetical protein
MISRVRCGLVCASAGRGNALSVAAVAANNSGAFIVFPFKRLSAWGWARVPFF